MEQKRQKLSGELETYRQAIVKAFDEVQEMEIVLDRTTKLYMEALKERRQMINQWTQSVNVLRQRDNDIQNSLKVYTIDFFQLLHRIYTKIYIYNQIYIQIVGN